MITSYQQLKTKERRSLSDLFRTYPTKDTSTGQALLGLSSELYLFDCCMFYTSCNTWVTTLVVKSYWESQSSSKKLCILRPTERSVDTVSTHYEACNQGLIGTRTRSVDQAQE